MTVKKLVGHAFGELLVLEALVSDRARGQLWLCRCACGNEVIKSSRELGQIQRPACRACLADMKVKHGGTRMHALGSKEHRLYKCWISMRQRCMNPQSQFFHTYGGKGVKVCAEWGDYATFRDWAYANGYVDQETKNKFERLSIDRIDASGDYAPGNCRWITCAENSRRQYAMTMLPMRPH